MPKKAEARDWAFSTACFSMDSAISPAVDPPGGEGFRREEEEALSRRENNDLAWGDFSSMAWRKSDGGAAEAEDSETDSSAEPSDEAASSCPYLLISDTEAATNPPITAVLATGEAEPAIIEAAQKEAASRAHLERCSLRRDLWAAAASPGFVDGVLTSAAGWAGLILACGEGVAAAFRSENMVFSFSRSTTLPSSSSVGAGRDETDSSGGGWLTDLPRASASIFSRRDQSVRYSTLLASGALSTSPILHPVFAARLN